MPLSEGATRARHARRLLQRVLDYAPDGTTIHPIVRIGRHAAEGIIEAAAEQEADLIIFGWGGNAPPDAGRGRAAPTAARARRHRARPTAPRSSRRRSTRSSATRRATSPSIKQRGSSEIRRVLVPVRGGPHAELAIRYADAIARHHDATVVVLHLVPPGITHRRPSAGGAGARGLRQAAPQGPRRGDPARGARTSATRSCARRRRRTSWSWAPRPSRAASTARPPVRRAAGGDRGAREGRRSSWSRRARRSSAHTFEQLATRAETLAAADRAAEEARAVPIRVERWFGEANFHHAEFADLRRLVQLKEKQGLTISLVLPTLDEEETIGPIVRRAMREMVGRVPLLDEVLVIDSASTDRTREIAEAEGARVVQHPDVLTRYGSFRGKGEALWKSIYETSRRHHRVGRHGREELAPRMVYGTLGPLLHEPRLQYVKGYYQRPIVEDGVLKEGGGGRVTELVARPLINLFYPELSGMIQPLAGEYAGRRALLEIDPVLHRLRGRDRPSHRRRRAARHRGAGPGRPRAAGPSQPGARGPVADVVRDPPGRDEAARGAAQGAPVRRDGLDDEAAALRARAAVARGHRAGRPGAPADDPDPRVRRAPRVGPCASADRRSTRPARGASGPRLSSSRRAAPASTSCRRHADELAGGARIARGRRHVTPVATACSRPWSERESLIRSGTHGHQRAEIGKVLARPMPRGSSALRPWRLARPRPLAQSRHRRWLRSALG